VNKLSGNAIDQECINAGLRVSNLSVTYDGIPAVRGISIDVPLGSIRALLGPNGAGKTSTLRAIAGLTPCGPGTHITLGGASLTGTAAHQRAKLGIALVPEGRGILGSLTVHENVLLGARLLRSDRDAAVDRLYADFPLLANRRKQFAGSLSGGEQQQLALARAIISQPRILLLDEPALGLAPLVVDEIFELIAATSREVRGILLVEQNARRALTLADRAYVIEHGELVLEDEAILLRDNDLVQQAYFGE
jgi:branched-chain amino acid transport system ATP-binding protein